VYTDYQILTNRRREDLAEAVVALMAQGWAPFGAMFYDARRAIYNREMVKEAASLVEYAVDGAIAARAHTAVITKASAAAMTLAAPSVDQNGTRIRIVPNTGNDVVVTTGTNGFLSGNGSGTAIAGNTLSISNDAARPFIELEAYNGAWLVDGFYHYYGYATVTTV
jgi:hypothetical protein